MVAARVQTRKSSDHCVTPSTKKTAYTPCPFKCQFYGLRTNLAYAATYPDAYKTLQSAIDYLTNEKGVKRIYVMGYSMGARMTTAFLASHENPEVVGYIGVGVLQGGGEIMDANINIQKLKVPVIDIYADSTPLDLSSAQERGSLIGDQYKQVQMRGANHSFRGYEGALSEAVVAWLKEREPKQ